MEEYKNFRPDDPTRKTKALLQYVLPSRAPQPTPTGPWQAGAHKVRALERDSESACGRCRPSLMPLSPGL